MSGNGPMGTDKNGDQTSCWNWQLPYNERARNIYWKLGGKNVIPYRLVYELVHGVVLRSDQLILHSCDNRICCNPTHMRIGTNQENVDERQARERFGLPHNVVRAIKKLISLGVSDQTIADRYGLSRRHINSIRNGKAYSYVKEDASNEQSVSDDDGPASGDTDGNASDAI